MKNIQLGTVAFIATVFCLISTSSALNSLQVSDNDLQFGVHGNATFTISTSQPAADNLTVWFSYSDGSNLYPLPNDSIIYDGTKGKLVYSVEAWKAGHTTIVSHTTPAIKTSDAFVRVGVYKVYSWVVVSSVIGWLYFIAWSISFYPQVIENYRRKSVVGLNFDFLGLNLTGFIAYSVFNLGLKYVHEVQLEYHSIHPTGVIPVEVNDVVFAVHAVVATVITIGQCFIYERGDQLIAKSTVAVLALVWSTAAVFLLLTALHVNKYTPWLTFLYFFSYVKLGVTLTKYIPQVVYNYQRKSTVGWSIGTVLLDFIGGLFSIGQMFIICYNYDKWSTILGNFTKFGLGTISITYNFFNKLFAFILILKWLELYRAMSLKVCSLSHLLLVWFFLVDDWYSLIGNFTKFGLGLASVAFDVIFMTQHFILYRHRPANSETVDDDALLT